MNELVERNIKKLQEKLVEEKDLDPINSCLLLLACVIELNGEVMRLRDRVSELEFDLTP